MSRVVTNCREAGYLPLPETPLRPTEGLSAHYLDVFLSQETVPREGCKPTPSWLSGAHGENFRGNKQQSAALSSLICVPPVDLNTVMQPRTTDAEALPSAPNSDVEDEEEAVSSARELLLNRQQVLQLLEELSSLDPDAGSATAKALGKKHFRSVGPSLVAQVKNARRALSQLPESDEQVEDPVKMATPVEFSGGEDGEDVWSVVDVLAKDFCEKGFYDKIALEAAAKYVYMDRVAGANIFHDVLEERLLSDEFQQDPDEVKDLIERLNQIAEELQGSRVKSACDEFEQKRFLKKFYKSMKSQLANIRKNTDAYAKFTNSFSYKTLNEVVRRGGSRVQSVKQCTDTATESLAETLEQIFQTSDFMASAQRREEHELPRIEAAVDEQGGEIKSRENNYGELTNASSADRFRQKKQLEDSWKEMKRDWEAMNAEIEEYQTKAKQKEDFRIKFEADLQDLERRHQVLVNQFDQHRKDEERKKANQAQEMVDLQTRKEELSEQQTKITAVSQNLEFQRGYLEGELEKAVKKEVDRQLAHEMKRMEEEAVWKHTEAKNVREKQRNELKAVKERLKKVLKEKQIREAKQEAVEAWEDVEARREKEHRLTDRIHVAKLMVEPNGKLDRKLEDCEHFLQKHGQRWRYDRATFEIVEKGEIRMPMKLLRAYRHAHRREMWKTCSVRSPLMVRWLAISAHRPDSAPSKRTQPKEWGLLPTQNTLRGASEAPWRRCLLQSTSLCNLGVTALDKTKDRPQVPEAIHRPVPIDLNHMSIYKENVEEQQGMWWDVYDEFETILEDAAGLKENFSIPAISTTLTHLKNYVLDSMWISRLCNALQDIMSSEAEYAVEDTTHISDPEAMLETLQTDVQEHLETAGSVLSALRVLEEESVKLNEEIDSTNEAMEDIQEKLWFWDVMTPADIKAIPKMQRQVRLRVKCVRVATEEFWKTVCMLLDEFPHGNLDGKEWYMSALFLQSRRDTNLIKGTHEALKICKTGLEAELAHLGFSGGAGELIAIDSPEKRLDLRKLDFPDTYRAFAGSEELDLSAADEELPSLLKGEPSADIEVLQTASNQWIPTRKRDFRQYGIALHVDSKIFGIHYMLKVRRKMLERQELQRKRAELEAQKRADLRADLQAEEDAEELARRSQELAELDWAMVELDMGADSKESKSDEDENFFLKLNSTDQAPEQNDAEVSEHIAADPESELRKELSQSSALEDRSHEPRASHGSPHPSTPDLHSRASTPVEEKGSDTLDEKKDLTVARRPTLGPKNFGALKKARTSVTGDPGLKRRSTAVFGNTGTRMSLDGAREALAGNAEELQKIDAVEAMMSVGAQKWGKVRRETVTAAASFFGMVSKSMGTSADNKSSAEPALPPAPLPPALQTPPDCSIVAPRLSAAWGSVGGAWGTVRGSLLIQNAVKRMSGASRGSTSVSLPLAWQLKQVEEAVNQQQPSASASSSASSEMGHEKREEEPAGAAVSDEILIESGADVERLPSEDVAESKVVGSDAAEDVLASDVLSEAQADAEAVAPAETATEDEQRQLLRTVAEEAASLAMENAADAPVPSASSQENSEHYDASRSYSEQESLDRPGLETGMIGTGLGTGIGSVRMQPAAKGSLRSASPDPFAMDSQRRSFRSPSPGVGNLDLADGPVDTAMTGIDINAGIDVIAQPPASIHHASPRSSNYIGSPTPRAFFTSSYRQLASPSPVPTIDYDFARPTPTPAFMDVTTPDLIRAASPAWVTAMCQKTAVERTRANEDTYLREDDGETPTPPPMRPRDRPVRLAYSHVPPRQGLLPLGGIDGRSASPACPPPSLQNHAMQQRLAETQRPPRPQTTEPRQTPEPSRRPHSVSHMGSEPPRPHSVTGRRHSADTKKLESKVSDASEASPEPQLALIFQKRCVGHYDESSEPPEPPPRPHSVMGPGPTRPHSVAGQAQRPHSVLGIAPSKAPPAPPARSDQNFHGSSRRPFRGQKVPERSESPESREHSISRNPKPDVVQRSQTPREMITTIEKSARSSHASKASKPGPVFHQGPLGSVASAWGGFSKVSKQAAGALKNSSQPPNQNSGQHAPLEYFEYRKDNVTRLQTHRDAANYHQMTRTPRGSGVSDCFP